MLKIYFVSLSEYLKETADSLLTMSFINPVFEQSIEYF